MAVMLTAVGVPSSVLAGGQESVPQPATLVGTAHGTNLQPLVDANVQVRNSATGEVAGRTTTGQSGEFTFSGLRPGKYVVAVLDASDRISGISAPLELVSGMSLSTSVMAAPSGVAAASGSGFSVFGLGPVASMTVLGAAGAAAVTAVVSTRPDASPSR
jgi:hypothetical protein